MVHAKNYETTSTFVKVMQKKPWPLFFRTRCTIVHTVSHSLRIHGLFASTDVWSRTNAIPSRSRTYIQFTPILQSN